VIVEHVFLIKSLLTGQSFLSCLQTLLPTLLIPELCETLPLVDMFYKCMLNFVCRYLNSQSSLLKLVVRCGHMVKWTQWWAVMYLTVRYVMTRTTTWIAYKIGIRSTKY